MLSSQKQKVKIITDYANSGDGEYWQPNDEKQNNHEAIV
jgi:hypothetical protein